MAPRGRGIAGLEREARKAFRIPEGKPPTVGDSKARGIAKFTVHRATPQCGQVGVSASSSCALPSTSRHCSEFFWDMSEI
jgi:hypothetical protein